MRDVIISCGHKWKDSGAVYKISEHHDIKEVDVNWSQTLAVMASLSSVLDYSDSGFDLEAHLLVPKNHYPGNLGGLETHEEREIFGVVTGTVEGPTVGTLSISDRISTANEFKSILIEMHNNIFNDEKVDGCEAIIFSSKNKDGTSSESFSIANSILRELETLGLKNRGVKEIYDRDLGEYIVPKARRPAILHKTMYPAVIIEVGFISNPGYRERLERPAFNLAVGRKVASAILGRARSI